MHSLIQPTEATTWTCDVARCGNTLSHDDAGAECAVCDQTICDGCTYECRVCEKTFCLDHIVATDVDVHSAIYECAACTLAGKVAA